jgi:transcriptional regulator with XRE-family HTH domain
MSDSTVTSGRGGYIAAPTGYVKMGMIRYNLDRGVRMHVGKMPHLKRPQRHSVSEALIELRALLNETQQQFANRLGTAVTTIARYETSRPPKGRVLAQLEQIAQAEGHSVCGDAFRIALEKDLGISVSGPGKRARRRSQVRQKTLGSSILARSLPMPMTNRSVKPTW